MKAYFTQLFEYDRYANNLMTEIIVSTNNSPKSVQIMAHLLGAQQRWLSRCKNEPAFEGDLWPNWQADTFAHIIESNHQAWISYLDTLNADDFEKIISYKNTTGTPYHNKLVDIITQVTNHGTHHRAQIGQELKLAGLEKLPITDYIFYIRD